MKKETINWKGVEALGYKRAIRLRKIEKALKKVLEYNFDVEYFLNSLDSIRERIEKNSQHSLSNN